MFDFPMNSPTNLRDLIVYDIHLWKTIDKSYKNYEKLCEVMKKEAISYDNYEYWFNRYLKESYYSAKNGRAIRVTDIRICIYSDIINEKSLESSYRDLCDAFDYDKIDKNEHTDLHPIYGYERCPHAQLLAERSKYFNAASLDTCNDVGLKFSDLPEDVVTEIVDRCDLKAYLNLRIVSHSLRTIVDKRSPPCTDIEIIVRDDYVQIKANNEILVDSRPIELTHSRHCSLSLIGKCVVRKLEFLLNNPKLRLKSFRIDSFTHVETTNYEKNFLKLLDQFSHKIHVERCSIEMEQNICRVLQCFKPGSLQKLVIGGSLSINEISRIAQTDQWKQAKHLNLICFPELSIEYFSHFSTFEISFGTISTNNLVRLCDNLSKSTNFESCIIKSTRSLNIETIKNARNLQPSDTPNKYYVPNSNLVVQFPRGSVAYEISIRKL
ncbi:hypothetical protein GCK72_021074 [Caenorhabditis remanei]|uniref:F-box domain-containing protein n=1 Tax=Caenorhabditis remanei TaxID=31234 RepID=A0A6A5GIS8_CAERE|nr:hypothetical protein GCK72_021074 [Caenorhabditis remanei]KAF1754511.1 hypothetical protein GCK72_021074 [Caenorhabditis remanei]